MVNEIIVGFLGPLPLPRHPESRPVTPFEGCVLGRLLGNVRRSAASSAQPGRSVADRRRRSSRADPRPRRTSRRASSGAVAPRPASAGRGGSPGRRRSRAARSDVLQLLGLDALGDRAGAEAVRELHGGPHQRQVVVVDEHPGDEASGRPSARGRRRAAGTPARSSRCRSRRRDSSTPSRRRLAEHVLDDLELRRRHGRLGDLEDQLRRAAGRAGRARRRRRAGSCGRAGCGADRLTATDSGRSGVCQATHSATASSSTRRVNGADQPGLLGDADELAGCSSPRVGCCQRTSASAPMSDAGRQVDLRLEVHDELVLGQRRPQLGRPAPAGAGSSRRGRRGRSAATTPRVVLGLVERDVGAPEQLVEAGGVVGVAGDPDAALDRQAQAVELHRLASSASSRRRDRLGRLGRPARSVEQDRELVAAEPGDQVARRRPAAAIRRPTCCRSRSPAACPRVSLISLKWSRSSSSSAVVPSASAAQSHCGRPAAAGCQPGQRVVGGLVRLPRGSAQTSS